MATPYTEANRAAAFARGVRFLVINGADNTISSEQPSKYAACVAVDALGGTSCVVESIAFDGVGGASVVLNLADARTYLKANGNTVGSN